APELDGAVAHAHELHPEALSQPRAVVALLRDGGLIPGGRPFLPGEDLADAAGEAALFRLDEVPDDLVRAPLVRVEMPRAVVAESAQLRLDEGAGGLEVLGDLTRGEVGRHETSCGALRTGTLTFNMTVPSARVSCVDSPRRSSRRSLRRRPDWSSPSGGSSFPSLCRRMSSVSSFQPIPRTMSLACAFSMRSLISDCRTTLAMACAGPSWTCRAMRLRSASCVSTTACRSLPSSITGLASAGRGGTEYSSSCRAAMARSCALRSRSLRFPWSVASCPSIVMRRPRATVYSSDA